VIIVGAGGMVGQAVVRRFLETSDSTVFAIDVRFPAGSLSHPRVRERRVDATSRAALMGVRDEISGDGSAPAVLVNCQGRFSVENFDEIDIDSWNIHLAINLTSVFLATSLFAPAMKAAGRGAVVNVASGAGEMGSRRPASHYAAAKGGVIAFSKSVARELAPFGVRVNVVSPGPLDTDMYGDKSTRAAGAALTLVNRLGSAEEVADAILYLASPGAGFVIGEVLRVNGGVLL
jgi:NAD(P)-dependent dehydrogenase (short-subunit alcohol dehydrogenase family)